MFEPVFEPVYVCRDSDERYCVSVIPAHVGIVKIQGCCHFEIAVKDENGWYGWSDGDIEEYLTTYNCRRRYGDIPECGEAWLVEDGKKYIHWTRVDQDLHLLYCDGTIVKEAG